MTETNTPFTPDLPGFASDIEEFEATNSTTAEPSEGSDISAIPSFDLEGDYKPIPVVPRGIYSGNITAVHFSNYGLHFTICIIDDTSATLSDGNTPLNGAKITHTIWFPKPEDASTYTKSGKQTKREWKINNAAIEAKALNLPINTPHQIKDLIENGTAIGHPVTFQVENEFYKNELRDRIKMGTIKYAPQLA